VDRPIYREVQHFFRQWIILLPVSAVTIIIWYEFIQQVVLGKPQGEQPIPDALAWALTLIFGLGFPALPFLFRLVTEVRPGVLAVRLYPFREVEIAVEAMSQAMVRQYSAIREYGGWGIRVNRFNGRAYNVFGDQGVQLILANGTPLLIGTQRPHELLEALRTAGFKGKEPAAAPKRTHEADEDEGSEDWDDQ